ncbi:MAG: hypothetical protein AAF685_11960 [Cyanobacteria bacterium P01_C01_bin.89]
MDILDQFDLAVDAIVVAGHGDASGKSPNTPYLERAIAMQKPHFESREADFHTFCPLFLKTLLNKQGGGIAIATPPPCLFHPKTHQ